MPTAVIEDREQFNAFLAAQPFCAWAAQKKRQLAMGANVGRGRSSIIQPPPKNDNADLMAALASMA